MDYILKTVDISPITLGRALTIVGSSLGLAVALMLVYMFTHRRTGWRPSIAMTMLMLGPIVSIIVLCIGSNIARAISIGGGLALVRFRNTVEDPRDLIYFFLSLASGMACGIGFIGFGALAVGAILLLLVILSLIGLDRLGGTLVRLDYRIVMKDDRQEKQFLDELRVLNGNLTISIVQTAVEEQ